MTPEREPPFLSIILATWQAEETLAACIESILGQTSDSWELLIADGGSADGTLDIIGRYEDRLAWWVSEPDKGIYDAWNKALPQATGRYVCFLGADDRLAGPGVVEALAREVGDEPYDLVTSVGEVTDSGTGRAVRHGGPWSYERVGPRMPICHPGLLHRRALFDIYGAFDSSYRICGDLDFLLRLPKTTRSLHVDAVTVVVGAGGVSRESVMIRLKEQREALARCERFGPIRAWAVWFDKLWRYPVARILGLPH